MSEINDKLVDEAVIMSKGKVKSPCVNNCCLDQEDICLGCFRHIKEIVGWKNLSDEDKQCILKTCETRKLSIQSKNPMYTYPSKYP